MKLRRSLSEPDEPIELNLIPLIDVIMFLLIFFISTTSFMDQPGVTVDKPQGGGAQASEQESIIISISSAGKITWNGNEIGLHGVRPTVKRLCGKAPLPVVIQSDENAFSGVMIQVIDEAKMGGAKDVSVASNKG